MTPLLGSYPELTVSLKRKLTMFSTQMPSLSLNCASTPRQVYAPSILWDLGVSRLPDVDWDTYDEVVGPAVGICVDLLH